MLSAILTYIGNGITDVFDLFGDVLVGGVALFWNSTTSALTELGEVMLLSAIVGLVLFGIRFIRRMIPFVK
jgi:hypothetical protein